MPEVSIGRRIRLAQQAYRAAIDRGLRSRGLTLSQHAILAAVGEDGLLSNAELARRSSITPQSAHELLRVLEERGLLERPSGAGPGRAGEIRLTSAGRRTLAAADARVTAIDARITEALGDGQARRLAELLAAATDALDEP
ncbi:MAG: MarR family winged helix-turn-helix transcriptional regulator [Chloroflexota bacterium]